MKKSILSISMLVAAFCGQAQHLEKTHPISKDAKRGNITSLQYSEKDGYITTKYLLPKSVDGVYSYEEYEYDNLFELSDKRTLTGPLEKLTKDATPEGYRGESYSVKGMKLSFNVSMQLEMTAIQTETQYTYNWQLNDYESYTKDLTPFKYVPKDASGYIGHEAFTDDNRGGGLILASARDKFFGKGVDMYRFQKDYRFLRLNEKMDLVAEEKVVFDDPHEVVFKRALYEGEEKTSTKKFKGFVAIFAPVYLKKITTTAPDAWTFVHVDENGKMVKNYKFTIENTKWDISDLKFNDKTGEIYIYGPANKAEKKGVKKYYKNASSSTTTTTTIGGEKKYTFFQIMKVKNGKVAYVTNKSLKEMGAMTYDITGPSKRKVYKARKFVTLGVNYCANGDFLLYGTNFDGYSDKGAPIRFDEAVAIHYAANGEFKKIYSIKPYEKNYKEVPMTHKIINDKAGKYVYWILEENAGVKFNWKSSSTVTHNTGSTTYSWGGGWKGKYLLYPRVLKVNLENATIVEFIPGNKEYYLDNSFPYIEPKDGGLIFFGSDKKGENQWMYNFWPDTDVENPMIAQKKDKHVEVTDEEKAQIAILHKNEMLFKNCFVKLNLDQTFGFAAELGGSKSLMFPSTIKEGEIKTKVAQAKKDFAAEIKFLKAEYDKLSKDYDKLLLENPEAFEKAYRSKAGFDGLAIFKSHNLYSFLPDFTKPLTYADIETYVLCYYGCYRMKSRGVAAFDGMYNFVGDMSTWQVSVEKELNKTAGFSDKRTWR